MSGISSSCSHSPCPTTTDASSRALCIFFSPLLIWGGNDVFDFPWSRSWFDDRTSTRSVPSEAIVLESQSREIPSTRVESILF